jgi:hypothetical protein
VSSQPRGRESKVNEKVAPHLEPGEEVLAVAAVEQPGRNKGGDVFTKVARVGANAVKNRKARQAADAAGFPFAPRMILVATQRRLLVFSQSVGSRVMDSDDTAVPDQLLGEVGYDRLYAARGQNAHQVNGYVKNAGWVAFRLMDGQQYHLSSWGFGATRFAEVVDQVLASRR